MPKLSPAQQAARRAHILDTAEICFARAGFHRTTMQDICREADVSPGGLYLYFRSKEALIDGIVARDRDELQREVMRVGEQADLMAGLEGLLRACVLDRPPHKAALYMEMMAEARRNGQIAAAMKDCEETLAAALTATLENGRRSGAVRPHVEPDGAARLLLLLGDGMFALLARRSGDEARGIVPYLLSMVEAYLGRDGAPVAHEHAAIKVAAAGE